MGAQKYFRREGDDAIVACIFDDIVLLYHRPSGQTHMVISPVPEILAAMADGAALCSADVRDRLAAQFDLDGADAVAAIATQLDHLAALGLVRAT